MGDLDSVTLGELYRICQRIELAVTKTNGRVDALEDKSEKLEQDIVRIKTYWSSLLLVLMWGGDWLKHKLFGA